MSGNSVIYEPKGAALEYSPLACNLYHGCGFGCKYCFAPAIAYKKLSDWAANPKPKKDILERLEKDAKRMRGDPRTILLCFTCDPYQSPEAAALTRKGLLILEKYEMTATVLTKGGEKAMRDFDILERNKWKFGTTLSHLSDAIQREWEPNARTVDSRIIAIRHANKRGIKTWMSVEPVMDTTEALKLIALLYREVDFWKIGKMNYHKTGIDWAKFLVDVTELCDRLGLDYYIKKELAKFGKGAK